MSEAPTLSGSPEEHRPARMFSERLASRSVKHGDVWRRYQIAYDLNDLAAGVLFVVGSILFFDESQAEAASTLFLIGSVSFCVRPLIHVLRDFHLTRLPG